MFVYLTEQTNMLLIIGFSFKGLPMYYSTIIKIYSSKLQNKIKLNQHKLEIDKK